MVDKIFIPYLLTKDSVFQTEEKGSKTSWINEDERKSGNGFNIGDKAVKLSKGIPPWPVKIVGHQDNRYDPFLCAQ